jgi:GDP-L-fucose synthase
MKVLLIGHRGFVGMSVEKHLAAAENVELECASRETGCDLRDADSFAATLARTQPDIIVNCAAMVGSLKYVSDHAADVAHANMEMLLNLYRVVGKHRPQTVIVQPIANCFYPGSSPLLKEEAWSDGPVHPSVLAYGSTRRMAITLGECYKKQFNVRSVFLIAPNMYGPNDSPDPEKAHALNALVSKFVKAGHAETGVEIWGTGTPIREWLYVVDFARVVHEVIDQLDRVSYEEPVNVAREEGVTIRELVGMIATRLDFQGKIHYNTSYADGAPSKVMSQQRFRRYFPNFEFTAFDRGIAETIAFYEGIYPY